MKNCFRAVMLVIIFASVRAYATVSVSSPLNGVTVGATAHYVASAATACRLGVASMGIYVDDKLAFVSNGAKLDTQLALSTGQHKTYVQAWDFCSGSSGAELQVTATNQSGVYISLPVANSAVGESVGFVATATTTCSNGVAAMGLYVNDQLAAVSQGAVLNQQIKMSSGLQHAVVQAWDNCGGATKQPLDVKVQGTQTADLSVHTLSNIQAVSNWNQWGELAPVYDICDPCGGINWQMQQHVKTISLSGDATRFDTGGTSPYGDVLWSNKLIGQATTEGIPDLDHSILHAVRHLEYNADVFVTKASVTQDLEFDVNLFFDGVGMEWGTECNNLGGKDWDIWDNVNVKWVSTGAPCNLVENAWNHVTIVVERLADNSLLYHSMTLNGQTANIEKVYPPFTVPASWYGMTVNYQMDGDYKMSPNTTYLDNLTVTYW